MQYVCTKTFGHDLGWAAVFRQHRAKSHCRFLHGYALSFSLTFSADELDDNGWVLDFGALKAIRSDLESVFDHKVLVAGDDPELSWFLEAQAKGVLEVAVVDRTGCESFAELVAVKVDGWLNANKHAPRVRLVKVTCAEHGANEATVYL